MDIVDTLELLYENAKVNATTAQESWSRKSGQDDKWSFCLRTAIIAANRRDHEQTTAPEPLTGLQGEGGAGSHQGRPDDCPTGRAFRRSPQSDYGLEIAARGQRLRYFRIGGRDTGHARGRCEVAARQDRGADAGE